MMFLIGSAANLAVQGGVKSADGEAVQGFELMGSLLLFDVLADDCDGCSAAASGEVAWRPKRAGPEFLSDAWIVIFPNHPARNAFQAVDQIGSGYLGRIVHEQMNVIVLAIELDQFSLKVITDAGEDAVEIGEDLFGENFAPVFCHEDQVSMHHKDTVSAVTDIVAFLQ
jgi:hypothetical protein